MVSTFFWAREWKWPMNNNYQFQPNISVARSNKQLLYCSIMDKSLGTLLHFWGIFQFTHAQPLASPRKHWWTRVSRIFSEFQLCIGWGEGELQKISKRIHCFMREHRYYRKLWILHSYPKDFCPGLVGCLFLFVFFTEFFSMFLSYLSCWGNTFSLSEWCLHMNASKCHKLHLRSCLPR